MNYLEVAFAIAHTAPDWQKDILINDLAILGFDTFEETDKGVNAYVPEPNFDLVALETLLQKLPVDFQVSYEIQKIAHQNWNELWESNFQPIEIAETCYIRASFHPSRADMPIEIIINPKMAFGTGHHETTGLMIEYLLAEHITDISVLDMGCGTGILGILAAKRGASAVVAIDHDPICVDSVSENSALNMVDIIKPLLGSKESIPNRKFHLILANINRNILLSQIERYSEAMAPLGILLMSGFYEEDLEIIKTEAELNGLHYVDHKTRGKWVAAKFKF